MMTILLCVQLTQAQDDMNATINKLADKIEKVVKQKEPRWKLRMRDMSITDNLLKAAFLSWKTKKQNEYVNVKSYVYISPETAARSFHQGLEGISGGIKISLKNLGDEAVIVTNGGGKNDRAVAIYILKRNIRVRISASDKETGMRFAKRIAAQLE